MVAYLVTKQRIRDKERSSSTPVAVHEDSVIFDADLRERLAKIPDDALGRLMRKGLTREQKARDDKASHLARLPPIVRRREIVRDQLAEPFQTKDRYHIHSVLALCGLPYKKPAEMQGDYVREYGRNSLVVQAGYLKDPYSGKMVKQGLPYGPKARLLLLHICTIALRQNTHEIEVADSMSAFIRELGFEVTGGARGTISQFKEQLHRLAAARMQIGLWRGDKTTTISTQPIEAFDVWLPTDPNQQTLWNTKLYIDEKFFRTLKDHALPVDIRTMRAFSHSAKQIDIVLWLISRLNRLDRVTTIGWDSLKDQFGRDIISRDRKFRQSFSEDIKAIQDVYPKIRLNLSEKGITLHPSDAKLLLVPQRKVINRSR